MIANNLPLCHPLLRLPFPRGGYQLPFLPTVACLFLFIEGHTTAKKLLCYSVCNPQQSAHSKQQAAKKLLCYSVFKTKQQISSKPAATKELPCYAVFNNKQQAGSKGAAR
jgi:hypothetical protein